MYHVPCHAWLQTANAVHTDATCNASSCTGMCACVRWHYGGTLRAGPEGLYTGTCSPTYESSQTLSLSPHVHCQNKMVS